MSKNRRMTYRNKRSKKQGLFKKVKNATIKTIPIVTKGLKNVGSAVLNVTKKATPVVEKGVGAIYDTLNTGFNLGVKGIKKGVSLISKRKTYKKSRKTRKTRRH